MNITFVPLVELHFPLLLKWLNSTHVKKWWYSNISWTEELIHEKYINYVRGYKIENGIAKKINPYIISLNNNLIGYVQIYNAYDFPVSKLITGSKSVAYTQFTEFPLNLGIFDIFIGEENCLKQGIGLQSIIQFLKEHGKCFSHIFVDPDSANIAAIRTYKKAGFKKTKEQPNLNEVWMTRNKVIEE